MIVQFENTHKEAWNNFVYNDPAGTFFHLAEWKDVMERAFGFKTYYQFIADNDVISGLLPYAHVKRPIFGAALISNPLCVYGGGLGHFDMLLDDAIKRAADLGVRFLEIRNEKPLSSQNWKASDQFFTFRRVLSEDHEENLKSIPRKQRAEIRKGIANRLEVVVDQDIDLFYKIYAKSVRNLGTPVFPKKYLKILIDTFGDAVEITTIRHQGTPLCSVLSFKYKDQIMPYYGGGLSAARSHSAYPYMYWKVMENAVNEGLRVFDFGRSIKDSGAYAFKKNFGFDPEPLAYEYFLVKATEMPNMDPDNPRNKVLTSLWKKLPLWLANRIGPALYPVIV